MNKNSEQIYRYLEGKLTPEEKKNFEERLRNDSELRKEFNLQKEIKEAISEEDVMELREKLKDITSGRRDYRKSRFFTPRIITVAASIVLLVGIGIWFLINRSHPEPFEIYNQYYEPYENVYSSRSLELTFTNKKEVKDAFLAYEANHWDKAEALFNRLLEGENVNVSLLFYSGIVKLEQNKNAQAVDLFEKAIQKRNPLFTEQAYWYVALAYLKNGNVKEAEKYFTQIVEKGMAKEEEAGQILKKL